jgi:uncharacterized membrane protein
LTAPAVTPAGGPPPTEQPGGTMRRIPAAGRVLLAIATVCLALFVYDGVVRQVLSGFVKLPLLSGGLNALTVIVVLFSVCHAAYALGPRHAAAFFAITAVVSWAFEEVGVATGLIYGPYHYTETLGPWLGSVPVLIPLAWFMMIYPSYVLANLIVDGRPTGSPGGLGHLAGLALLGALVMAAWDLVVDPILSGPVFGAWGWEQGGPYFGIPVHNYLGWIATVFTVYVAYRVLERRWVPRPAGPLSPGASAMPILAYAAMLVSNLLSGGTPEALVAIAPIAMGMPVVAAFIRLVSPGDGAAHRSARR